jgi:pimeloyl-ACP methyl ester carboxylesterase
VTGCEFLVDGTPMAAAVALPSALTGDAAKAENSISPISNLRRKTHDDNYDQGRHADLLQGLRTGQPIVFSHGWPLTADDWDGQMLFFGQHGYRVIANDRRGHGRSSQTIELFEQRRQIVRIGVQVVAVPRFPAEAVHAAWAPSLALKDFCTLRVWRSINLYNPARGGNGESQSRGRVSQPGGPHEQYFET